MKKLILSLAALSAFITLFLCVAIPAHAETYSGICGDDLTWRFDNDTGTLTIYGKGEMDYHFAEAPWNDFKTKITTFVISDKVTSIRADAFQDCSSLTSINIPDSVTSIGNSTFNGCSSLTSINIPNGVTSIGHQVFSGCSSLTSINIPDGVTSIYGNAFYDCSSLKSVHINSLYHWFNIDFQNNSANPLSNGANLYLNGDLVTEVTFPSGITCVRDYLFSGCKSIERVTLPDGVTNIGDNAFYGCSSLTSINIPDSVTVIGYNAFGDCCNLKEVHINDLSSWCRICFSHDYMAFCDDGEDRVTANPLSYGAGLYLNDELITDMIVPDDIEIISLYAFMGYSKLKSVQFHKNVSCILLYTFYGCEDLNTIIISNGISKIDWHSFTDCHSLSTVIFCGTENEWNSTNILEGWNEHSCEYSLHYHDFDYSQGNIIGDHMITCKYCGTPKCQITENENDNSTGNDTEVITDPNDELTETNTSLKPTVSIDGCDGSLDTGIIIISIVIVAFTGSVLKKKKQ